MDVDSPVILFANIYLDAPDDEKDDMNDAWGSAVLANEEVREGA